MRFLPVCLVTHPIVFQAHGCITFVGSDGQKTLFRSSEGVELNNKGEVEEFKLLCAPGGDVSTSPSQCGQELSSANGKQASRDEKTSRSSARLQPHEGRAANGRRPQVCPLSSQHSLPGSLCRLPHSLSCAPLAAPSLLSRPWTKIDKGWGPKTPLMA